MPVPADIEINLTHSERDLDEKTRSLLFAPNHSGIHDTRYTNKGICPTDTGHPIRYDGYAACIPGIDSRATPSPITPTTPVQSDFDDDDGAEFVLTPLSVPQEVLIMDDTPAKMRRGGLVEGHAEVERAQRRGAKRSEMEREEAMESDEVGDAVSGSGCKRKRNVRQTHPSARIDNALSDEVMMKTGPADRRRRANERNDCNRMSTSTTHSTRLKSIPLSREGNSDDAKVEGNNSGGDSRVGPGSLTGKKGRKDVAFTGTWVEGLDRKTDDYGHVTFRIQNEKTGSWAWRYPCLQSDHRDQTGQQCRKNYAQHKDLVRHVGSYNAQVKCDGCGAKLSRGDAIHRHKLESCEAQKNKGRRAGRR